jgi:hypothetical protein
MMEHVKPEFVSWQELKPHPRNYKQHPPDQLEHLMRSIKEHGFYRNVVVAEDYTILAGHGVVLAVEKLGLLGPEKVPVVRLPIGPNDPRALKLMMGDNEMSNLGDVNDRLLADMLREVKDLDDLLGTGFNQEQLAALAMVSRPRSELKSFDEAAHWVGMPEFVPTTVPVKLTISFDDEAGRDAFLKMIGATAEGVPSGMLYRRDTLTSKHWSMWWPLRERHDNASLLFETQLPFDDEGAQS